MSYDDFDRLKCKYILEFTIVNITPLSIRSGKSPMGLADNSIVRIKKNGKDIPYIPGSSLKGIMRCEAERYVRTTMKNEFVCDILHPTTEDIGELWRHENLKDNYKPCVICRIFGGPTIASHIYVYDAYPYENKCSIDLVRRVSISRITGAQMPGRLFDIEFVNPKNKFKGKIVVENIDLLSESIEAKIFNYVIKLFLKGLISIGSMKSIGYGSLKIENLKVTKYWFENGTLKDENVTEKYLELLRR